ncbi:glycosyltransferase family 4 protein [Chitinibacter sp. S2-10]|uniref:glycosyltransferase family 4 protein n=1 Tax=Chitinibacter sp. S2-10 TaxID=3373597 RepID=UPI0039772BD4
MRINQKASSATQSVLFMESSMNIGGQELQLLQQMSVLQQQGWAVSLLCKTGSRIEAFAKARGLDVDTIRFRNALHIPSILQVRRHLQQFKPAAVIVHSGHDANIGAIACHSLGRRRPMIVRMRTYQPGIPNSFPYQYLFDYTLACSAHLRERILKNTRIDREKVGVLYPGIDFAGLEEGASDTPLPANAERWLADRPGPVVLQAAMLREEKGHSVILDALPEVLQKHPDVRYLIAGEGPLSEHLKEKIAEKGLQDHVCLLGMVNPIGGLLRRADLAILPSLMEPFGMFQIEALNLGIPTIASNVDGIPETMTDREDGLLVEPGNPAAWAQALVWALDHPEIMRAWAEHGRQKNRLRFSLGQNTTQLIELITRGR